MPDIKYYSIDMVAGKQIIAAERMVDVLYFVGNFHPNIKNPSPFNYNLESLEEISKENAQNAPLFKEFNEHQELYPNKVYVLGVPEFYKRTA